MNHAYPVASHAYLLYRAQVEGFTGHFETCEALKAWVANLDRKFHLEGSTVLVWKAKAVTGRVATYTGNPDREIVIGGQP